MPGLIVWTIKRDPKEKIWLSQDMHVTIGHVQPSLECWRVVMEFEGLLHCQQEN